MAINISKFDTPTVYKKHLHEFPSLLQTYIEKIYTQDYTDKANLNELFTVGGRMYYVKEGNRFVKEKKEIADYLKTLEFRENDQILICGIQDY